MGAKPNFGLVEWLVAAYFVASIPPLVVYNSVILRKAAGVGAKVPFFLQGLGFVASAEYDHRMGAAGRRSHARRWMALLVVNAILAAIAFRTVLVPKLEKMQEQRQGYQRR